MKIQLLAATIALALSPLVGAAPVILQGNYVLTAVGDDGTLGAGNTTPPGIKHDPSGTGNFGVDDYLTPGTPWEIFSVKSNQTGLRTNNNSGGDAMSGSVVNTSGSSGYDNSATWTGGFGSYFSLVTDTYFNDGDERISFKTTITALTNLTGLQFLRALDPDPDVFTYGSYYTVNGRGAGGLAPEDWVHSEGTRTGLTIGLYSDSSYTHNTGISSGWSTDPSFYLAGTNNGNGDYTIGLAFDFGSLNAGDSVTFNYHYIMGESLETVVIPPPVSVPAPAALALLGLGLFGLGAARRRR